MSSVCVCRVCLSACVCACLSACVCGNQFVPRPKRLPPYRLLLLLLLTPKTFPVADFCIICLPGPIAAVAAQWQRRKQQQQLILLLLAITNMLLLLLLLETGCRYRRVECALRCSSSRYQRVPRRAADAGADADAGDAATSAEAAAVRIGTKCVCKQRQREMHNTHTDREVGRQQQLNETA